MKTSKFLLFFTLLLLLIPTIAQEPETEPECLPEVLAQQKETFEQFLTTDFEADSEQAIANLYRLGAMYQDMALGCGYAPTEPEVDVLIDNVLTFASLDALIQAQSVGSDVDEILTQLDELVGDPLMGQELYNGLEPALGGAVLGCSGCHANELIAPPTEGTWTRVNEVRLQDPALEGYTETRFFVESITHPEAYIAPNFTNVMPNIYSSQLTPQQLADIVAFLNSQDQLLED